MVVVMRIKIDRMSRLKYYWILDGHTPVYCPNIYQWTEWIWQARQDNTLHVGLDYIGEVKISTVFLGRNAQIFPEHKPLLFETMVFGLIDDEIDLQCRYSTWEEALKGHQAILKRVEMLIAKVGSDRA